jgi:thiamine kinase-like enzyme
LQQLCSNELVWLSELNLGELVKVKQFAHAITNQVFLLTYDNQQAYIFKRLNMQARNQQQRKRELLVQKLASDSDLTPKLLVSCDNYRLQAYFPGKTLDSAALDNQMVELFAAQLHLIHQLPALYAPPARLAGELQLLKKQLTKPIEESRFNHFLQLATQLDKSCTRDLLCHGDLSFNNLLVDKNGQIKIIDWEYAVLACAAYDLAACCSINKLNTAAQTRLINHYYLLNQEKLSLSLAQFNDQYQLYHALFTYLNELWSRCFFRK